MKISRIILGAVGVYAIYKLVELLNFSYEEEVNELKVNIKTARLPEEEEYYDPEYTLDEDILDELEALPSSELDEVVEEMSDKLDEEEVEEQMIPIPSELLSKRQDMILRLFDSKERLDADQIAKKVKGATVRTIRRDLTKLEELGYVKKVGKTKGSYYIKIS